MKKILVILFIFGLMAIPAVSQADIYMKRKQHTDAVKIMGMAQPAIDVIEEIWITKKGLRSDNPQKTMIMLTDQHKVIMLDHATKTYFEKSLNMNDMMPKTADGKTPEESAAMQGMMKNMMKMDASVQPTSETKKIKGWMCKKYILTMNTFAGTTTNEVWATQDLKTDQKLYDKLASSVTSFMPDMGNTIKGIQEEMKKIKGVQVKSISTQNIMNQTRTSTIELIEYKEKKAPKNLFQVPKGYTKKTIQ